MRSAEVTPPATRISAPASRKAATRSPSASGEVTTSTGDWVNLTFTLAAPPTGLAVDQLELLSAEGGLASDGAFRGHVQGLTGRFEQVNEGMRVQSQGAEQIREAMIRLSEAANQTTVSLREFNKATDSLREAVSDLKEEVSRFAVGGLDAPPPLALDSAATPARNS